MIKPQRTITDISYHSSSYAPHPLENNNVEESIFNLSKNENFIDNLRRSLPISALVVRDPYDSNVLCNIRLRKMTILVLTRKLDSLVLSKYVDRELDAMDETRILRVIIHDPSHDLYNHLNETLNNHLDE